MTTAKQDIAIERRKIARSMTSDKTKEYLDRMNLPTKGVEFEDFVGTEYHDLRWGWFYYLTNKNYPSMIFKLSYSYKAKRFEYAMFTRATLITFNK